jgi:acyl-CoA synthetase (AMP-forming)/AMP-acid ligase II
VSHLDTTILDRLQRHAQDQPDRVAFTFLRDNGTTDALSFRQLEQRVYTLAARFAQRAEPGDRALMLYPPGLEFIAAFLGCLSAGIVAVPAPTPRKNRANLRLQSILQDAAAHPHYSDVAPTIPSEFTQAGTAIRLVVTDGMATDSPDYWQVPSLQENTLALLQYTSGSTGTPRGVMVSHANLVHNQRAIAQAYRHTRDTVIVGWLPVFHDMGLIGNVLSSLYVGFPCVLFSPVSFLREPVRWLRAITHYKGTCAGAPNFAYDYCVRLVQTEEKQGLDLSSWMTAFNAAEPVRAETLDRFAEAFAGCGFRREAFFPNYGLAEATLFVSGGPPDRLPRRVRLCGHALEENRLELASADNPHARTFVGCGELGERDTGDDC